MFPSLRQRLVIAIAAVAAGLVYLRHAEAAIAPDGAGLTLLGAAAPTTAIIDFVLATLPGVLLAAVAAAAGNPLAGVFTLAAALAFPAVRGGSIDLMLRAAESSAVYWRLVIECFLWIALWAAAIPLCYLLSRRLRPLFPSSWRRSEQWRDELEQSRGPSGLFWGFAAPPGVGLIALATGKAKVAMPESPAAWFGGLVVAVIVGALAAPFLLRSSDIGQVVWGLFFAFVLAGLAAHQVFPTRNPMGILLSPLVVAIGWYAWIAATGDGSIKLLGDFYRGAGWAAGLALPIHYASAAVAGVAAGVGWSQTLIVSHPSNPHQPQSSAPPLVDRRVGS